MAVMKSGIVAILLFFASALGWEVYVDVEQGTVLGRTIEFNDDEITNHSAKINVFRGIPYAEKPTRFKHSMPKQNWTGIHNATEYTYSCYQLIPPEFQGAIPYQYNEDCLALNVFAPNQSMHKLPVMVFIHGGGYTTGSSMTPSFSGVPLAAFGHVVVVTINYRVGAAGFLSTDDEAASGNYGLMDQALALHWVRQNIEAFGGNSSKVTIFGESAGGSSVDMHVISKHSQGLFDQAITQSGQAVALWNIREEFEKNKRHYAFKLGMLLNCTTTDSHELIECLRHVDPAVMEETVTMNMIHMGPTIDGYFIDDYPVELTHRGEFKDCPMIIGFNRDEGTVNLLFDFPGHYYSKEHPFISKNDFDNLVTKSLLTISGFTSDLMEDAVKNQYVDWEYVDDPHHNYLHSIVGVYGDDEFSCPAIQTARAHAMVTSAPVYVYYMTHVPEWSMFEINGTGPGWLGAGHAEEIPFIFGYPFNIHLDGFYGPMTDEEKILSLKFMAYWAHFAWTGHPSPLREMNMTDMSALGMSGEIDGMDGRMNLLNKINKINMNMTDPGMNETMERWIHELSWLPYTVPELHYKNIALWSHIERGLKADECAFWNKFKLQLQGYLVSMDQTELEWREEFDDWQDDLDLWRMSFYKYSEDPYCDEL